MSTTLGKVGLKANPREGWVQTQKLRNLASLGQKSLPCEITIHSEWLGIHPKTNLKPSKIMQLNKIIEINYPVRHIILPNGAEPKTIPPVEQESRASMPDQPHSEI